MQCIEFSEKNNYATIIVQPNHNNYIEYSYSQHGFVQLTCRGLLYKYGEHNSHLCCQNVAFL